MKLVVDKFLLPSFFILIIVNIVAISIQTIYDGVSIYFIVYLIIILLILLILVLFIFSIKRKISNDIQANQNIQSIVDDKVLNFGGVGYILFDDNKNITWISSYLLNNLSQNIIGKSIKIFGIDFTADIISGKIQYDNNYYEYKLLREINTLIFKDVSLYEEEVTKYDNEILAIGIVNIDNYNKILNSSSEASVFQLNKKIVSVLLKWSWNNNIFIKKISIEQYIIITNKANIQRLKETNEFKNLLKIIISNSQELKANINFSIGIAFGMNNSKLLYEEAVKAIEFSLARGGDQLTIRDVNDYSNVVYGEDKQGRGDIYRNKLKRFSNRIVAKIKNCNQIYIAGHIYPDFDSLGACLGMYLLCKSFKVNASIIINEKNFDVATKKILRNIIGEKKWSEIFINTTIPRILKKNISKTGFIVLDTSSISRIENKDLINKLSNVFVIDHHRISENDIINASEKYIDTFSSSSCEIVGEIMTYFEKYFVYDSEKYNFVFSLMVAGITVDTNHFKHKASSRTFEIASKLKDWGANSKQINELLKESFEATTMKNSILQNSEKIDKNISIAVGKDNQIYSKKILAIVAQELIDVRGIEVSFVIGKTAKNIISVSCRSLDNSLNVQKFAEQFNGGGHFNASAFEFKNSTITLAKENIIKELKNKATIMN